MDELPDYDPASNKRRFDDDELDDLPDLPTEPPKRAVPAVRRKQTCNACGSTETRVVSNQHGIRAHCVQCKNTWPIAASTIRPEVPLQAPRGISKKTLVEPDWDLAFQNLDDDYYKRSGEED